ncbi:hypothetical protein GCM10008959_32810 [Deinococcus seoulensis]|uniref:Peptidase S49 domain-containing protein n=1 Tax=Deinococcus seoulensis TaxID=1837379 RepID=A0ABQ2RUS5_9DEIO|nr:S49 family peptidase [Deinococcus seoulensis]GGR68160.1 hypothetical protein GCM10008959_32810 [Deinococcus seoulensis]
MSKNLSFLTREMAGTVWSITSQALDHVQQLVASGQIPPVAEAQATPEASVRRVPLTRGNGKTVGVVSFHGVVINRCPSWAFSYGYMSPQAFAAEIRELADDPMVASIVISVDSPGGTVAGTVEAAEAVAYAKSKKRVTAVVADMACSAAYWVAAQASEIVVSPTALTGSIGCIISHADYTKVMDTWGILVTYIRSAAKKALGQPYEPLSAEGRAEMQRMVDDVHAQFVQAVAKGRRKARGVVAEQWATGEVWTGVAAVTAGLADRVGSLHTVIGEGTGAIAPPDPQPPTPNPGDEENPEARTTPSLTANGDPDTPDAEQPTSPTDDPPATTEAGSPITPQPAPNAQEAPMKMTIAAISAKLAAGETLSAEERTFLDDHLAAQSAAAAAPATPGAGQAPQPNAKVDLSALTPEAREAVEKAQADAAAANARAERAENTANTERDQRLDREFRERAVQLGQPATFGATLRAASEKMTKEEYASLEQSLNATGAQLELIGERGSHQDRKVSSDAKAEYRTRVDTAMNADPNLTRAQAGQKVMRDDPAFAARYRNS